MSAALSTSVTRMLCMHLRTAQLGARYNLVRNPLAPRWLTAHQHAWYKTANEKAIMEAFRCAIAADRAKEAAEEGAKSSEASE